MSLRASSRTDSKLVIYGAGGLASPSRESVQIPPHHHTLKLEPQDTKPHHSEPLEATPFSRASHKSPPNQSTPPQRGSVADVEHKSVSSLFKEHTPHSSSPLHHRHTSSGAVNDMSSRKVGDSLTDQSSIAEGARDRKKSYVQEVGSPVKSFVFIDREEQGLHHRGNRSGILQPNSSTSQSSLQGSINNYNYNKPPPKVEWYHSDILKSPSHELERGGTRPWYLDDVKSPVHSQESIRASSYLELGKGRSESIRASSYLELGKGRAENTRASYRDLERESRDSVQSQPNDDQSLSRRRHYHSSLVDQTQRHSVSVDRFQHNPTTNADSDLGSSTDRFYHAQSVDRIESRDSRHSSPAKQKRHHHHHHKHHHTSGHHSNGGRTRSSRSSSDLTTERRSIKSSSLTRDLPPRLQEEEEPEGQSSSRYLDRNHPAKPQNRGQFRLSLPESSYYDNGNRAQSRHSNARRSRKALSNTGFSSNGSLSQPADMGLVR